MLIIFYSWVKSEPMKFYLWVNSSRMQKEISQMYSYVYAISIINSFSFIRRREIYSKYTPKGQNINDKSQILGHIGLYTWPIFFKWVHPDWQTFVGFIRPSTRQFYNQTRHLQKTTLFRGRNYIFLKYFNPKYYNSYNAKFVVG